MQDKEGKIYCLKVCNVAWKKESSFIAYLMIIPLHCLILPVTVKWQVLPSNPLKGSLKHWSLRESQHILQFLGFSHLPATLWQFSLLLKAIAGGLKYLSAQSPPSGHQEGLRGKMLSKNSLHKFRNLVLSIFESLRLQILLRQLHWITTSIKMNRRP